MGETKELNLNRDLKGVFFEMVQRWPSAIVCRDVIDEFTGGAVSQGTMANLDSRGEGPEGKFSLGSRKVCYPAVEIARWLQARAEFVTSKHKGSN